LKFPLQARAAQARALFNSAALGSIVGLAIGGAYLAGGVAQTPQPQPKQIVSQPAASLTAALPNVQTPTAVPAEDGAAHLTKVALDAPAPTVLRAPEKLRLISPAVVKEVARPFHMDGALQASRDLECLSQAVYFEARGEPTAGQQAVAQVILNRVRHPSFPKTVCGVVYQGCQFSFACNGAMRHGMSGAAWDRARSVAEHAMNGFVMTEIGNATSFHAARMGSGWSGGLMKVAQIGAHIFYRFAGSRGSAGMFHEDAQPSRPVYASFGPMPAGSAPSAGELIAAVKHAATSVGDGVRSAFAPGAKAATPAVASVERPSAAPASESAEKPAIQQEASKSLEPATPAS
jgi:spore germination cell wall hydrolase CwlJ-like protein